MEKVLDGVRPFLSVAGGSINIQSLTGISSIQVTAASLQYIPTAKRSVVMPMIF